MTGIYTATDSTRVRMYSSGTGERITYIGGGVDATCAGQGNRLLADSAEHYSERGLLYLFYNVRYTEPGMQLTSERMTYYTVEERLVAQGDVKGKLESGTRFEGPEIDYYRAAVGVRDESSWTAPGRPFVRMRAQREGEEQTVRLDSLGNIVSDSVDIFANTIRSRNDSLVWASGNVLIERFDMRATADSAMLDNGAEFARLLVDPVITGKGERPFTLDGEIIDLWSRDQQLERVVSMKEASVLSDSLTLTGDTIDIRLADQLIERVFAWGGRSRADAPSQRIDADSLDILMPGQRLSEVRAVGSAMATSYPDTAKIFSEDLDWIAGDTIFAFFETESQAVADSNEQPRMREVVATGSARSLYQMAPSSGEKGLPNISYSRGRVITVRFENGEAKTVDVLDQASGLFLEPVRADTVSSPVGIAERRP